MRSMGSLVTVAVLAGCFVSFWPAATNAQRSDRRKMPATATASKGSDGLMYVWIPPGTFQMGCSPGDNDCNDAQRPSHQITISKGFWMGQTEVPVGAYKRFSAATGWAFPLEEPTFFDQPINPGWENDRLPIVNVTWDDAVAYCQWTGGRLPTEAEWEYAARAGTTGPRYGDLDAIAWYADNAGKSRLDSVDIWENDRPNYVRRLAQNRNGPHEVGQKIPNAFGLYDTLGNVWEWVADWYDASYYAHSPEQDPRGPSSGEYRVLRGGSWSGYPSSVRAAYRGRRVLATRHSLMGLRCVREGP